MSPHRILYPGRFQPFHMGHLHVVMSLLEEYDEIVIAIGSAQEAYTCRNPFTAGERITMIHDTLVENGVPRDRYWLIPVPDIHMPPAWTAYLLSMIPQVEAVATGNPQVAYLYRWLGLSVVDLEAYEPEKYNGTLIRMEMCKAGDWRSRVPGPVATHISRIGGAERVRRLCSIVC